MAELPTLTDDRRLRNHFNIDKRRRTNHHRQKTPHLHPYYELYFLQEGCCRFFLNNRVFLLQTGDLIVIPPFHYHMCSYDEKGIHDRFTIYFDEYKIDSSLNPFLDYLPSGEMGEGTAVLYHVRDSAQSELFFFLNRMLEYYRSESLYADIMLDHLIPVFLLFLSRNLVDPAKDLSADSSYLGLEAAAKYISRHYMEPLTLEQAAQIAGFTPSYFSRKFKEVAGIGFRDYLTHIRISESARLLRTTSISIQDISQRCGFSSGNYFGDVFRSIYHVSPREYRKGEEE